METIITRQAASGILFVGRQDEAGGVSFPVLRPPPNDHHGYDDSEDDADKYRQWKQSLPGGVHGNGVCDHLAYQFSRTSPAVNGSPACGRCRGVRFVRAWRAW